MQFYLANRIPNRQDEKFNKKNTAAFIFQLAVMVSIIDVPSKFNFRSCQFKNKKLREALTHASLEYTILSE